MAQCTGDGLTEAIPNAIRERLERNAKPLPGLSRMN